ITDCRKFLQESSIHIVRPAMLRIPPLGRLSWLLANEFELRREFEQRRPDVVLAYGISNALLARRAARIHNVPFVYHLLDALHTLAEPAFLSRLARPVERAVLRTADRVIVVNNHLRHYAVDMG